MSKQMVAMAKVLGSLEMRQLSMKLMQDTWRCCKLSWVIEVEAVA